MLQGVGGFAIFGIVLLFILRRGSGEDDEEEEDYVEQEQYEQEVPVQGPPATAFAGPPATITQPDPMEEYQRQVEEYNRKMAEYQAWQDAQGSQGVVDSTNHE